MENVKAYGAGLAGGQFDLNSFLKKPTVIFRCAAFVLGAGLWYCVSKGAWHKSPTLIHPICLYNHSAPTCSFGSAFGFFSMAGALALLIADARFERISSIPTRKRVVIGDLAISASFAAIFVISFFTLWSKYSSFELEEDYKGSLAKMAVLLSFLSAGAWGGAAFFAWRRYEEGAATALGQEGFVDQIGTVPPEHQEGYGYGGSSEGIGAVGSVGGGSYQNGGAAPQPIPTVPPTNPFAGQDGYGY